MINAAFQLHVSRFEDLTEAQFDRTMKTNLYGYLHMSQETVPHMKRGGANREHRLGHTHHGQQGPAGLLDRQRRHSCFHPVAIEPSHFTRDSGQCGGARPGVDAAESGGQAGEGREQIWRQDAHEAARPA